MTEIHILAEPETVFQLLTDAEPGVVKQWTTRILHEIATGARNCNAVWHPLSFYCFPFYRRSGNGLCVHYWPARQPEAPERREGLVHSHSWTLRSRVLVGNLANCLFTVTEHDRHVELELYLVENRGTRDEIQPMNRAVSCERAAVQVARSGEAYELGAGIFHATESASSGPIVTVVAGQDSPHRQNLLVDQAGRQRRAVTRQTLSTARSAELARALAELISKPGRMQARASL